MTNRKQKNLRLDQEYHDKLENLAEEWFNSKKKQGQVVERLIDMHSDNDMIGMIEDIHEEVCLSSNSDISTHTQTTKSELEKKIDNETVTEDDLKNIKNKRGIDKAKAFRIVLQDKFDDHITKDEVREYIEEVAGYEYNGANQLANSVLNDAYSLPDVDQMVKQRSDEFTIAKEAFGVDIKQGYTWTKDGRKNLIGDNIRILLEDVDSYRSKFAKNIASELSEYQQ